MPSVEHLVTLKIWMKMIEESNIFSWLKDEKAKVMEMDMFEEKVNTMDKEIQMEVTEMDLDKEDRLCRVRNRQKEFWTRRMVKEVVEGVLEDVTRFRTTQGVNMVLEGVLEVVVEHALVNTLYKEVLNSGPGAMDKLES